MYVVILAGGGGTRLRPLSTADRPKPFLPLLSTGDTLLQRTVSRLVGPELPDLPVTVVAAGAYEPLIRAQLPGIDILTEPVGRNTAPAIALAALAIDRPDDDVMVVLPADHWIATPDVFRGVLRDAASGLAPGCFGVRDPLVTLGIQPTYPATVYGYLVPHERRAEIHGLAAHPLRAFEEKPTFDRARELRRQADVAWNAGMFLWRRRAILDALAAHAPDILDGVRAAVAADDRAAAYAAVPSRSIDYAVMEPAAAAGRVVMASMEVGWTDVGTWPALLAVLGAPGIDGEVVEGGAETGVAPDDLVIERTPAGLVVTAPGRGTITAVGPIAVLRSAHDARPVVQALLDRVDHQEVRA